MADSNITGGGTGGGGGGLHFRDPVDVFATEAARGTAFGAGGTLVGEHVQFESDRSLAIVIGTIANPTQFQTYTGGTTYDDDYVAWIARMLSRDGPARLALQERRARPVRPALPACLMACWTMPTSIP